MKGRAILLDAPAEGGEAAALLIDGRLEDLLLRSAEDPGWGAEALTAGRVDRLLKTAEGGRGAAFLDLGGASRGYMGQAEGLTEGQTALGEIRTFPENGKAWPLTRKPALRSRRLALTPSAPGLNISRAIKDKTARDAIAADLQSALGAVRDHIGCVARSVAAEDRDGLAAEAAWLLSCWRAAAGRATAPGLLRPAPGPAAIALREWSAGGLGDPALLATPWSLGAAGGLAPALEATLAPCDPIRGRIRDGGDDLFERFDVWGQAETTMAARQPLACGATLTLEPVTALVAVDVDAGTAAASAADLAAAAALPRLLRLRGLGGLIAVDFVSQAADPRRRIESALARALARDGVETEILGWTRGGLLELKRKRSRRRLTRADLAGWVGEAESP